jgi:hypothetical protein
MAADPRGSDQAAGEPLLDDDLVAELADDLGEAGLETLIGVFSSDLVQRIGALRAALETADLQAARRILHAMAGSSAWIGAVSLAARCRPRSTPRPNPTPWPSCLPSPGTEPQHDAPAPSH